MIFQVKSKKDTDSIAGAFTKYVFLHATKKPLFIGLNGDLGAGKTAFAKSFIKLLGVKENVVSPTFNIMKRYSLTLGYFKNAYHIDAYRVKAEDLLKLDFKNIVEGQNIVLVEWVDRITKIIPKNAVIIDISHTKKAEERIFKISPESFAKKIKLLL